MGSKRLVDAVLFDTFGTVVDWRSGVSRAVAEFAGEAVDADEFALAWRSRYQPSMKPIRDGERDFVDLDVLHRENLDATAAEFGLPLDGDPSAVDHLNRAWHRLPAWPDSVAGLTEIKRDFVIGPLSNGHTVLLTSMAKHAGLPWDVIIGSDLTRTYKPDARAYLRTAEVLRLPPERVMLCAAHNLDLAAARDVGLRTAFIPRPTEYGPDQRHDLHATSAWDVIARDVTDLASQLRDHAA